MNPLQSVSIQTPLRSLIFRRDKVKDKYVFIGLLERFEEVQPQLRVSVQDGPKRLSEAAEGLFWLPSARPRQ